MSELKEMKGSDEDKEKITNILKNMKAHDNSTTSPNNNDNNDNNDDDNALAISSRLEGVDLDDADALWERLSVQEKDMFQMYVTKGNLNFVPTWKPWWCGEKRSLVVELDRKKVASDKSLPKLLKQLPPLKELLGGRVVDLNVKFCTLDVLLGYLCAQRVFNGDLYDDPVDAFAIISKISKVLSQNKVYSDVDTCLHNFVVDVTLCDDVNVDPVSVCLQDLHDVIVSNKQYIHRALADFYRYLKKCRKHLKEENAELSQSFFKMSKKVYFHLVYCEHFHTEVVALADDINKVQQHLLLDQEKLREQKEDIEKNLERLKPKSKNTLIEEIV